MKPKIYLFDTRFHSLRDGLAEFLKKSGVYYESSEAPGYYHFSILCYPSEVEEINRWLDSQIIVEVTAT